MSTEKIIFYTIVTICCILLGATIAHFPYYLEDRPTVLERIAEDIHVIAEAEKNDRT